MVPARRPVVLVLLFAAAACGVSSVQPFYRVDQRFIVDSGLVGVWKDSAASSWASVALAGRQYRILYGDDKGRTGRFIGRMFRLDGQVVLDVMPDEVPDAAKRAASDDYWGQLMPLHALLWLSRRGDRLALTLLNGDSLRAYLRRRPGAVRHTPADSIPRDSVPVLTAPPGELQTFLREFLRAPNRLADSTIYVRVTGEEAAALLPGASDVPCFEASAWPEADALFHRDPHWAGGDAASSVDLGQGRILWLFGDSWVDTSARGTRRGAAMVSNTVAIQTGTDPSRATIRFYWGRGSGGAPAPFIPDRGEVHQWFGNGVRVDDRLVLFLHPVHSLHGLDGHESAGWSAYMVDNPDDEPSAWRVRELDAPPNPLGILVGFAAVVRRSGYVAALGSLDPVKSHPIYAVRWPAQAVHDGDLRRGEWWAGRDWVPDSSVITRWPLFENAATEISVHFDSTGGRYLAVHTMGSFWADVTMRAAPTLTGPWSAPRQLYRPPEYGRSGVFMYAAKAHPELTGADLALTYNTNSGDQFADSLIYYPRFVRLARCR